MIIARYFFNGEVRAKEVITKIMKLNEAEVFSIVSPLLQEYSKRHHNITQVLLRHFKNIKRVNRGKKATIRILFYPRILYRICCFF
jgi:type II secretory pathway component PulF